MPSERAMKKALDVMRTQRAIAEALDAERWTGMEEAAEIADKRHQLNDGYSEAQYEDEQIASAIRTKIEAEKKEAVR